MLQCTNPRPPPARIGRITFAAGLAAATASLWLGLAASERALPALARLLNPYGVNAGIALNAIWLALGATYLVVAALLLVRRLRDAGRPPLHSLAGLLAVVVWSASTDQIFLWRHRLPLPDGWDVPLSLLCGAAVAWVLLECLLRPSAGAGSSG